MKKKKYTTPIADKVVVDGEDVLLDANHVCCSLCTPYWHCDHSHINGHKFYDDCSNDSKEAEVQSEIWDE